MVTGGIVAYANEVKLGELGVPAELIEQHGAVSAEVAEAMARGARERLGVDAAVSVTGIAGPGGGTEEKPVGLVYFHAETPEAGKGGFFNFPGDRDSIRTALGRRVAAPVAASFGTESRQRRVEVAGSVSGDERLRLFLALTLPAATVDALADWQARELERGGQTARIVPRENLHITLAFLGSRPAGELPAILDVLGRAAADAEPVRFDVTGYRETRSVGMLTLGDEVGAAARLAGRLHAELAGARRLPPRGATVAAARDRAPLPRAAAAATRGAVAGLGVVRRGCFPFTSAPVRGAVRGARLISARRLIR